MNDQKPFTNQTLLKHLTYFVSGSVIGIMLFTFLFYNEPDLWLTYQTVILGAGLVGVFIIYLLVYTTRFIGKLTNWQNQPGVSLLVSIVTNCLSVYLLAGTYVYVYEWYLAEPISEGVYLKLAILVLVFVLIYSITNLAISSYQHLQQHLLDSVKLETRQVDLQLTALKSQLTPHFLFNSLNTISSLIHKDTLATEQYIRNLAKVYQYTLPSYSKRLVSFEEEWSFVVANLDLLKARFGSFLNVTLDDPSRLQDIQMPPLTLQLLIENALKHNRIDANNTLSISIERSGKWWRVTNNITEKPNQVQSFKVGLGNIRERYQLLAGKSILIESNDQFSIKLPVL